MLTGLAAALWTLTAALGPNGYLVEAQLSQADHLPLEIPRAVARGWWVVFHRQDEWTPAFFMPPEADVTAFALNAAITGAPIGRLLPALRLPRLFLYAPYYLEDERLLPFEEMAADVAEAYLYGLFEASITRNSPMNVASFLDHAADRAEELMLDAPRSQRLEAYLVAVREFISHLLSIANEIDRADRRARGRQRDLCALLDPPRTLFALWQKSAREAPYPGLYRVERETGEGGPARTVAEHRSTRRSLEAIDKSRVLAELLGGRWTGDAARDFGALCP